MKLGSIRKDRNRHFFPREKCRRRFYKKYKLDFYKEIVESWQSLFPYKIFFSIGATIKQYTCSICGHVIRPRNKCIHKKGKLYNGKLCVHVADGGCELKEISMVKILSKNHVYQC